MATAGGWLKGCGIGCGIVVLVTVISFVGCGVTIMKPFKGAQADREQLDERYGAQAEFRPAPDGSVAPERVEAFLAVRDSLRVVCADFSEVAASIETLDEMDEDAPKTEAIRTVFGAMDDIMAMPALMGRLAERRNAALLRQEMGLGEYTYIYVTAYLSWLDLLHDPERRPPDGGHLSRRQRRAVRAMFQAQLEDLRASAPDDPFAVELAAEVDALDADDDRIPWQDGVPALIAASYESYRDRLLEAWCPATADFDLAVNRTRGLSVQAD